MVVIHTNNVAGINLLYPTIIRPRHGLIKVVELSRFAQAVPRLLAVDAFLLLMAIASFGFEDLITYVLIPAVLLALGFRIYQTPIVEVNFFSQQHTSTIAPCSVILEHCAYFFAIVLMCMSIGYAGGGGVMIVAVVVACIALFMIFLPFLNILIARKIGGQMWR